MKSTGRDTGPMGLPEKEILLETIKHEKETLVSMFLSNASVETLAAQYKLIDELNTRINTYLCRD